MGGDVVISLVWGAAGVLILVIAVASMRVRRQGPGAGAAGTTFELLSQDKRRAIELIVEERAEARDAETADGAGVLPEPEKKTTRRR